MLVSVFTTLFAVSVLYSISTQRELWILILIALDLALQAVRTAALAGAERAGQATDVRNVLLRQLFLFMHLTVLFVAVKLFYDLAYFLLEAAPALAWYDYVNLLGTAPFFVYFLLARVQTLHERLD